MLQSGEHNCPTHIGHGHRECHFPVGGGSGGREGHGSQEEGGEGGEGVKGGRRCGSQEEGEREGRDMVAKREGVGSRDEKGGAVDTKCNDQTHSDSHVSSIF